MKHFMFGKLKTVIWRVTEVITFNDIYEKTRFTTSIDTQREREKEVITGFYEKITNLGLNKKVTQKGNTKG